ncbi:hypothetical protein ACFL6C_11280 [Myxococcota bacterium]
MNHKLIAELHAPVKEKLEAHLREQSVFEVASLTWIQGQAQQLAQWICQCTFDAWREELVRLGKAIGLMCPQCGQPRRWKWRRKEPMKIEVLGFCFELPKPYLECGHCDSPGLSIMKVLTGLNSGDASVQLKLMAAYSAAKESYGKATQALAAHHGQEVERTKVRRMALEIEQSAVTYATDPSALDAMVPILSKAGERSRRMLAIGVRSGLGDNTQVRGLGDMGSGLAASFEEAFVGYSANWSADWKHTRDYVETAGKVLMDLDVDAWCKAMKSAIWARDAVRRNELLAEAEEHRFKQLPAQYEKCPVHALTTYLKNNWKHMLFAERKQEGLPLVSARAESQVRARTKARFSVAGAWSEENLEGKAILRAIIADGRWESFKSHEIGCSSAAFELGLVARLQEAFEQGRIDSDRVSEVVGELERSADSRQDREGQLVA